MNPRLVRLRRIAHVRTVRESIRRGEYARADYAANEARNVVGDLTRSLTEALSLRSDPIAGDFAALLVPHISHARAAHDRSVEDLAVRRAALREAFRRATQARRFLDRLGREHQLDIERRERSNLSDLAVQRWYGTSLLCALGCTMVVPSPTLDQPPLATVPDIRGASVVGVTPEDAISWP